MISIAGYIFVNYMILENKYGTRSYKSHVEIVNENGVYTMLLKTKSNQVEYTYMFHELTGVINLEKKAVLRFRSPRHEMLILSNDVDKMQNFLKDLMSLVKNLNMNVSESFQTNILKSFGDITGGNTLENFNPCLLKMVALENCNLSYVLTGIGSLTISSLSLSGSKLNIPYYGPTSVWDWMTKDNICKTLNMLEMNSIGLKTLPYEIIYLKNLNVLSVSNNKLIYLPHFIGELKELSNLFIDGNKLQFLPDCLSTRIFRKIRMSNNYFKDYEDPNENEYSDFLQVPTLLNLSVLSLMNNRVKFERQTIPYTLGVCYDLIGRCKFCRKTMILNKKHEKYIFDTPITIETIPIESIYWQYFECVPSCFFKNNEENMIL